MNSISISALSFSGTAYVSMSNRVAPTASETEDQADEALGQDKPIEAADEATAGPTRADGTPLAPEEIQLLEQLKQTDRDVRQHEMAHQIAGGAYTSGASYEYEMGPDGKRYAVAGEVPIDYGPVPGDPQATIEKMQTVIAAAMAPADPSPKDLQIAAQARQYLLEAKLEAAQQQSMMAQARGSEPSDPETAETPLEQMA
ncbi:putative metalloprotease CJM1_0395 family protein [Vreelandella populi]|uniref:putative metalloprotease CJM1_0395 family protein n=1 Tax=Vreelandella populi TaxID=2498858 RepID=UPI000F8DA278|nr:putative metalloprotease CJM1_0395 family protein [Halomonas populi]RUR52042.1 SprA-related family protein [Halomonas populi]